MAIIQPLILSILGHFSTRLDYWKHQTSKKLDSHKDPAATDLGRLGTPSDIADLPRIEYAYDPLAALPDYFNQDLVPLSSGATTKNIFSSLNSVKLDPVSARLPYRCSLDHVYASKFWESNLSETVKILSLLAEDDSASDIEVDHGITVAKLARKALCPGLEHQMVLATHYMFPGANEQRIKQISALMIMYFVFDDKVEETPNNSLHIFRDDFFRRLEGYPHPESNLSAFKSHMNEILDGIDFEDLAGGDGGREMLDALRGAFRCVHPHKEFYNIHDYFHFRRLNVGAAFVIAAAKFSIKSSVSVTDRRFGRYLSLVGDHLGLVNDLASYDKELRALNSGETGDMINIVAVMKSVTSLQGTDEAKSVVWALQLQIEKQMMDELEGLRAQGLTDEEWWFLEAVASTAVGNVMFCMTTSRYGGETARIGNAGESTQVLSHKL